MSNKLAEANEVIMSIETPKPNAVSESTLNDRLCVGTRIKFNKYLGDVVSEDCPAITYANEGDEGEITGHGCKEGYWVRRDVWPAPFGCERKDFDVLDT